MEIKTNDGLVVVDKPSGLSSFLVVKLVARALGVKKAGHMGTLDPLASGVLVVGVGKGTKLFDKFLRHEKEYYAEYEFGYETDTLDLEGQVTARKEGTVSLADLQKVLPNFLGTFPQMPPIYSAKKVGGKKACDLAREGKEVTLTPKQVEVKELVLTGQVAQNKFGVRVRCSSGFYVRCLGRDLGAALGMPCTTTLIRRTECCGFNLDQAQTLEEIKSGSAKIWPLETGGGEQ